MEFEEHFQQLLIKSITQLCAEEVIFDDCVQINGTIQFIIDSSREHVFTLNNLVKIEHDNDIVQDENEEFSTPAFLQSADICLTEHSDIAGTNMKSDISMECDTQQFGIEDVMEMQGEQNKENQSTDMKHETNKDTQGLVIYQLTADSNFSEPKTRNINVEQFNEVDSQGLFIHLDNPEQPKTESRDLKPPEDVKSFMCKLGSCQFTCEDVDGIVAHTLTHQDSSDDPGYMCILCANSYTTQAQLTHHVCPFKIEKTDLTDISDEFDDDTCEFSPSEDDEESCPGMRHLFPILENSCSLLEQAWAWVHRHNDNYFTGWSEEDLANVHPTLKPLKPITEDVYNLHMSKSEYCCNEKLKFCLESDAECAADFTKKLGKPVSEGGFTGFDEVKLEAAEVWQNYSKNDDSKTDIKTDMQDAHTCDLCSKGFISSASLKKHIKTKHRKLKENICTFCEKSFQSPSQLTVHTRIHTGERPYACETCGESFIDKARLKEHGRKHTGEPAPRKFICMHCGKSYGHKSHLTHHVAMTHVDTPSVQCTLCGKMFFNDRTLKMHMKRGHLEKKCVCGVCGRSFAVQQSLTEHMRTHTGEKPYTCAVCNRHFTTAKCLRNHSAVHGERNFHCTICNKSYARKQVLVNHNKNVHGFVSENNITIDIVKPFNLQVVQTHCIDTT